MKFKETPNSAYFSPFCSFLIVLVIFAFSTFLAITAAKDDISVKSQESYVDVDKEMAISQLTEFRGRLLEISFLSSYPDMEDHILRESLDYMLTYHNNSNPYLSTFYFSVPDKTSTQEICQDLILQIDNHIDIIKYG